MKLSLFDLHCDTAKRMLLQKEPLAHNSLHVSLDKASCFWRYVQVMALFTPSNLSDEEGWECIVNMWNNLRGDPAVQKGDAVIRTNLIPSAPMPNFLLAQEDARILCNQLSRVDQLYSMGIRILTPLWKGNTCIGGAHDTNDGLSAFGKKAIARAITLGMIPDISHASEASANEIFEIATRASRPVIASHSNAYRICPVSRNLRDGQILLGAHIR
jgi:membrane dipeptidase